MMNAIVEVGKQYVEYATGNLCRVLSKGTMNENIIVHYTNEIDNYYLIEKDFKEQFAEVEELYRRVENKK